ncbi:LacI family DNA-binding transcriptional regulator [Caldalkalibacillus salinus]|uniref:LacI family DNA-binding transcriptional regulator n=1 Tax=Caldalkalibacillus salinus TaxID=2803787 RepID=UPI00192375B4|nr:LacI family DNA-binding transcriptional regulator [Caldalkalibacillus salinus]
MATIRDVANLAKVSVATVSRVLNDSGYVNNKTKTRVLEAMRELHYTPSTIARSLNNKRTKTIGLVVPDITNPFFPELARAVEDVAQHDGYTVILCNSDEHVEKERRYFEVLKQKYIDGVILASNADQNPDVYLQMPVVVLDRKVNERIPTVVAKNREGGRLAVQHLEDVGCTRIAHIAGPQRIKSAEDRKLGYLETVSDQPWYSPDYIVHAEFDIKHSEEATTELLAAHPEIDGIFAGNDLMAVGALKAIHRYGKKVPEDIAIIGFDNISLTTTLVPELSTIAQPLYEMGSLATRLLIQHIEQRGNHEHTDQHLDHDLNRCYELDIELIVRASTARKKHVTQMKALNIQE